MKFVRFSVGGGAVLFSMVGFLMCLAGIVGVWMVSGRVEAVADTIFSAADESLAFVNAKMDRVKQAVDTSRQRVSGISKLAQRLRDETADARKESESLLQALDEIFQQLKAAETWLDSCQGVAAGVSRVAEAVVSSEYAASHDESTGIALAQRVQALSESVADILAKLQVVRQEIVEIRDSGRLAREVAARIVARVTDLDGRLANVSARVEKWDAKVANTKASLNNLQQRVHWWMAVATVAITLMLAWFGVSQIVMIGHGWRWASSRQNGYEMRRC
jgi:chromosome segregation ATPase